MLARMLVCTIAALAALPVAAHGATFTVNSVADRVDAAPGDGVCAASTGRCTLRAAIMEGAFEDGVEDVVNVPPGRFELTLPKVAGDDGAGGDLDVRHYTTVVGAGPGHTIVDANGIDRAVHFAPSGGRLRGMTLTGGDTDGNGGGLLHQGDFASVSDLHVLDNRAAGDGGGIAIHGPHGGGARLLVRGNTGRDGGGIWVGYPSESRIGESAVVGNTARGDGGGLWGEATGFGGGLRVVNSTFSGNTAERGGGVFIRINSSGSMLWAGIEFSTITANTARTGNAAGVRLEGRLYLRSSIVAGNTGTSQCALVGTTEVVGVIAGDATCGAATVADPLLGPLADNGGPTPTHAILHGSPAKDATSCDGAREPTVPYDQRLAPRPAKATCDVGAYEAGSTPPPLPAPPTEKPLGPDPEPTTGGGTAQPPVTGTGDSGTPDSGNPEPGLPIVTVGPPTGGPVTSERPRTVLRVLRQVRRGSARVEARCVGAAGQVCAGRIVLRTRSGRTLSLRARGFRIPAGYSAVVVLPLNSYARRLLRGARAVRVAAVVRP